MEFLLGVFTGIALCMAYGHYLNNQKKKEQERRAKEIVGNVKNILSFIDDEMARFKGFEKPISEQLKDAIARDDFEEAARLRDLMKKG